MSDVHGAVYNTDFIFASCRVDGEFRKSFVKTKTNVTAECTESARANIMTDDNELQNENPPKYKRHAMSRMSSEI